jgi:hypothetical protein
MQPPEQSGPNAFPDPPPTDPGPEGLVDFVGYLADTDVPDEVQLRESAAGETGQWLVLRRADIVEQRSDDEDSHLKPGQSLVFVAPETSVVFRSTVPASRAGAVGDATRPEPRDWPERWPRRGGADGDG